MNTYPEGSIVTVTGTFRGSAGTPVDPTAVFLSVRIPGSSLVTYTYGVGAEISRTSTGVYASDLDTTGRRGLWIYTWWSTGNAQADSGEQEFYVE